MGTRLDGVCSVMHGKCSPFLTTGFAPRRRDSDLVSTFSLARSLFSMELSTSSCMTPTLGNLRANLQHPKTNHTVILQQRSFTCTMSSKKKRLHSIQSRQEAEYESNFVVNATNRLP